MLEPAVLALAVDTKLKVCGGGVLLPAGGEITLPGTTGAVSRLPNQLPKTLINRMPNQLVNDSELLIMFTRLTLAVALPLVALPARWLPVTVALPLVELSVTLLLIELVLSAASDRLLQAHRPDAGPTPLPKLAEVVPAGALKIRPYHCPSTLTKTSKSLLPTICWLVRFNSVRVVVALPLVALPAL